jgi:protocatechuate 3,4-dioxygenase beta subunit
MFRQFLTYALVAACAIFPMASHATLSGTITDAGTGLPIAGATLRLSTFSFPGSVEVETTTTDAAGHYALTHDGSYLLGITRAGYLPESHNVDTTGTVILDRAMSMPARIRGHVRDAANAPLSNTRVSIAWLDRPSGMNSSDADALTGPDGSFDVPDRHAGTYRACIVDNNDAYRNMCYSQRLVPADGNVSDYTPVAVASGAIVNGIDFMVPAGSSIRGTLRDSFHDTAIANTALPVSLNDIAGNPLTGAVLVTDAAGNYAIGGLPAGPYKLAIGGWLSPRYYTPRVYGGATCDPTCSYAGGTPVVVPADTNVIGVDMALHPGVVVSGRVTGAEGEPLAGVLVIACSNVQLTFFDETGRTSTDADGRYEIAHLRALPTRVGTKNASGHLDVNWPAFPRPGYQNTCYLTGSEFAVATDEERLATNFSLDQGASVSGHVSDAATGLPIRAAIAIRDDQGREVWRGGSSAADGNYVSTGLPNGTYYVHAWYENALSPSQLYQAIECGFAFIPPLGGATPLSLTVPLTRTGVDFIYVVDRLFYGGFQ